MSQDHRSHTEDHERRIVVDQVINNVSAGSKITAYTADDTAHDSVSVHQVITNTEPGIEIIGFDGTRRP